jgi:asparagine synthase (glutamine-hydrolysing)
MCGFVGIYDPKTLETSRQMLQIMNHKLRKRGPDGDGYWECETNSILMAHRRLSVVDLSVAGKQPMTSATGRYTICFNGEIYNHLEIRKALPRSENLREWAGSSDTETLLAAIEEWGFSATVKLLSGMFSIALWDQRDKVLYLTRDRIGEKPLYYGWQDGRLYFASDLSAITADARFRREIDPGALGQYLRFGYVPTPLSIFKGIQKLGQGTIARIDLRGMKEEHTVYWRSGDIQNDSRKSLHLARYEDKVDYLEDLLYRSIKMQMIADVPIGAFLSGGIDSSLIVALMSKVSAKTLRTYSIGFEASAYDETHYAKKIADHLGTLHTSEILPSSSVLEIVNQIPKMFSEPFADSSQIPTHYVSMIARRDVTVALTGDAGDELFGGYDRYVYAKKLNTIYDKTPKCLLDLLSKSSTRAILDILQTKLLDPAQLSWLKQRRLTNVLERVESMRKVDSPVLRYRELVSHWNPKDLFDSAETGDGPFYTQFDPELDYQSQLMLLDLNTYLPDDILVKVDRAAMFNSLETRVPFLNEAVVSFALGLPIKDKIRNGSTKMLLRSILNRHVPSALFDRPKMGFGVPLALWLNTCLKTWANELIEDRSLFQQPDIDQGVIKTLWRQQVSGEKNNQYKLWNILMYLAWKRYYSI